MAPRRGWMAALAAVLAVSVVAPAAGQSSFGDRAYRRGSARIDIRNFAYGPHTLSVTRGATVVFVNRDGAPHDAKKKGGFSTGLIRPHHAAALRFGRRGVYKYYCSLHPYMRGKIVVR